MPSPSLKEIIRPAYRQAIDLLPPRWHVMFDYLRHLHRLPNLDNPQGFNEKIAWRKLYDRNPLLPVLVDKVRAKDYVAEKFGAKFVIPTLAVYDMAAALDFNKPPLSQPPYVLKTNHGGNGAFNIFVKEKLADPEAIRAKLAALLKIDYANVMEEWAYSLVPRKILVESFIETPEGYLTDYKFHMFSGRVFAIEMVIDRFKGYWINLYDRNWKRLDIQRYANRPPCPSEVPPPSRLAEMIELAEAMTKDFPYVRLDLYEIDGQVKFGEFTFYPGGGFDTFDPPEWDRAFGREWQQNWTKLEAQ